MHNLLDDALIRVRLPSGKTQGFSLPSVLAALSGSGVEAFIALMPHQKHAWYAFLVQLAAIALNRASQDYPPAEAEAWCRLLHDLTPSYGVDEPWRLIVEDVKKPAFLQSPVPEGNLKKFKGPFEFPDEIDVLVTTKNHDVKMTRVRTPYPDHWIYALVALQTMQGYSGQGHYEISRMNSGYGSRPCVSMATGVDWGSRFRRDVRVLLEKRGELLETYPHYCERDGLALLWLEKWDGESALALKRLDPYYIEICQRVRLVEREGQPVAYTSPTKTRRLAAKDLKGNTGDPWTPIKRKDGSALTISSNGFTYGVLQEILFSADFQPGACQRTYSQDPQEGMNLLAFVMVRGQGKTEGLHERHIPIPAKVRSILMLDEERDKLARLARERVEDAGNLVKKALKPALLSLLQGGPEDLDFKDDRAEKWLGEFDRQVDEIFFTEFWEALERSAEEAQGVWQKKIVQIGEAILREAERALPIPAVRRYRALSEAERRYFGGIFKNFPLLHLRKEIG